MRRPAGTAALILLLLAATPDTGHCQPKCAFTHYSVEDGLSEGVALTMHQDREEYVERKEDITDIIAFTTAPSARLFINGKQVGKMETDQYATVIWRNIKLSPGKNHVEIKTADGTDSVDWIVK